ncbi:MAG: 50S ribosomal protein L35 [Candidatus Shikimatogenerans bostrichidophilus]|nr:MAG: 50S ribosomal protein L35 [Candidatus Shikimatogenerans bostrichidophilus]
MKKKYKIKKSYKKRFKLIGNNKIKRKHAFKNHNLIKKSKNRKKRLSKLIKFNLIKIK